MADETIVVPDFKFSGMYYPQVLRSLRQYRRANVPEITAEDDHEPFEQLLRSFSLASHFSAVLLDAVALEGMLPTAKLVTSVRDHLALIDYQMDLATPAQVDALIELSKTFSSTTVLVAYKSSFSTERTEDEDEVVFEYLGLEAGYSTTRTDQLGSCLTEERTDPVDPATATFADKTADANSVASSAFSPWTTAAKNDALYIAHPSVMWDQIDIDLASGGGASGVQGVWECYDGEYKDATPVSVVNNGPNLTFDIDSLLGTPDRTGALVRVTYLPTGAYEDVYSIFTGGDNEITTVALLGQTSTPSTSASDYAVGSLWNPLDGVDDETDNFQVSGTVKFTLPQTATRKWISGTVDSSTGFFIRYRVVTVSTPTSPSIESIKITEGSQYVIVTLTQGETVDDTPLGSSNGEAKQTFRLGNKPLIAGTTKILVGAVEWTETDDFLTSGTQDKHFKAVTTEDDETDITFNDGVNGAIPVMGVNNIIASEYRVGGDEDGNIPANTLTINRGGLAYVNSVTNPRAGLGWKVKEGGTDADMARVKLAGPASVRVLGRAVATGDAESLAADFQMADGTSPVVRAYEIEEAYGPKTVQVVVVGAGGTYLTVDQLAAFALYLNGDKATVPPTRGVGHSNTEYTVVNYMRKLVDVTVTAYGGNKTLIENAISAGLNPLKLKADAVSYQWDFGSEVPQSVLIDTIHDVSGTIRKVLMSLPTSVGVVLGLLELPYPGTIAVTVVV